MAVPTQGIAAFLGAHGSRFRQWGHLQEAGHIAVQTLDRREVILDQVHPELDGGIPAAKKNRCICFCSTDLT